MTSRDHARALDDADPLRGFRDTFVGSGSALIYFDGNSLGRPPRASVDRLARFATEEWGGRLIRGWDESWMQLPFEIGDTASRCPSSCGRSAPTTSPRSRCWR